MSGLNPRVLGAVRSFFTFVSVQVAFAVVPSVSFAQEAPIYATADLDSPPKFASADAASRLVKEAYPAKLKRAGVGGTVQVQFVIDQKGKVEESSIEVIAATLPQLGEAAKQVVAQIEFKPAQANGAPVRARVLLPLTFRAR